MSNWGKNCCHRAKGIIGLLLRNPQWGQKMVIHHILVQLFAQFTHSSKSNSYIVKLWQWVIEVIVHECNFWGSQNGVAVPSLFLPPLTSNAPGSCAVAPVHKFAPVLVRSTNLHHWINKEMYQHPQCIAMICTRTPVAVAEQKKFVLSHIVQYALHDNHLIHHILRGHVAKGLGLLSLTHEWF